MVELRGVILDVDGTLVDTNEAHAHAWVAALAEEGVSADFERIRLMIGEGGDKILPEVAGVAKDSPQGVHIDKRRKNIFLERFLPRVAAFAGATQLLYRMRDDGLKLIVASSSSAQERQALLTLAGGEDLVDEEADAAQSKPDPDIVQAAVEKSGFAPDELVMLGDTPYDVQAAQKAGVACIALRCGGWSDVSFGGAVAIYNDPADLLANYDHSPLAKTHASA